MGAKNIYINHMLLMKESRIINNDEGEHKDPLKYYICYPTKYI